VRFEPEVCPHAVIFMRDNWEMPQSKVGYCYHPKEGQQEMNFPFPCYPENDEMLKLSCILHEMMHTIGLYSDANDPNSVMAICSLQFESNSSFVTQKSVEKTNDFSESDINRIKELYSKETKHEIEHKEETVGT